MKDFDRIVNFTEFIIIQNNRRLRMKIITKIGTLTVLFLLAVGVLWAGPLTGGAASTSATELHEFFPDTVASATEVNDNFVLVRESVNTLYSDVITGVTPGSGLTGGGSSGDVTISVGTGAITATHLGTNSVAADEIAAGAVGTSEIADGSVSGTDIANSTITSTDIVDGTITGADIASNTITASDIAAGGVGTSEIADGSVTATDLASSSVYSAEIANNSIYDYDIVDEPGVEWAQIARTNVYVRGAPYTLATVSVSAPTSGYVIVRFDGYCYPATGDRLLLAASNIADWGVNDGHTQVYGYSGQTKGVTFSHSRVYSVGSGATTFYAVAENYVDTGGNGYTSVYGTLVAIFVPTRY